MQDKQVGNLSSLAAPEAIILCWNFNMNFLTGGKRSCHFDSIWCSQWQTFHLNNMLWWCAAITSDDSCGDKLSLPWYLQGMLLTCLCCQIIHQITELWAYEIIRYLLLPSHQCLSYGTFHTICAVAVIAPSNYYTEFQQCFLDNLVWDTLLCEFIFLGDLYLQLWIKINLITSKAFWTDFVRNMFFHMVFVYI